MNLIKRNKELEEELNDIKESYEHTVNEDCEDEIHCTCVPALRARIKELEAEVKLYDKQFKQLKENIPFLEDSNDWTEEK